MLGKLRDWCDHRVGYKKLMDAMLLEHIPGGAKWRYVWGSTLMFVFSIQLITGLLLMLHYSPGDSTAWGSVYFIQYEMDFGWLIRGLHHFGSQTMVVLLAVHMLQVVIAGAQLPPREFNWWIGLGLMGIVLGLSLTGYLLPWDQKGYYATRVATNIASNLPVIGDFLQRVVVGGPEYGHHTLTQFFTLHVGILPALMVVLIVIHLVLFRRHGVTAPAGAQGVEYFWPGQAFRDLVACLAVFGVMLGLVLYGHGNAIEVGDGDGPKNVYETWAKAGQRGLGANLDAPADRATPNYPARPEWYFLFLFQLLKYFKGDLFLVGAVHIPNAAMLLLFILPLLGYGRMRKFGHAFGIIVVVALLGVVGTLTFLALVDDSETPILGISASDPKHAKQHHEDMEVAEVAAKRAVQLAHAGIPEEGGLWLLRNDPLTRGPVIFQSKCASCHSHAGEPVSDEAKKDKVKPTKYASDLTNFGSKEWIRGLLKDPASPKYFGLTKKSVKNAEGKEEEMQIDGMIRWRAKIDKTRAKWKKEDAAEADKKIAEQDADFDLIAKFLAEQAKPSIKRDKALAGKDSKARELFMDTCTVCHSLGGEGSKTAPDLTDYGSAEWLRLMIMSPASKSRHGDKNLMPAFRPKDGPSADVGMLEFTEAHPQTTVMELSDIDREVLIRWLLGDYRVVFGGQPISGAK